MYVIDRFTAENPPGKSPQKKKCFVSHFFVPLDQTPKIKVCRMVASEHTEVIQGRQRFISTDVLDSKEAAEDGSIHNDGAALDKEDEIGLVEAGVITSVTKSGDNHKIERRC